MFKRRKIANLSDADLVKLAKQNHKHFGVLYDRYFEQIFKFIYKRLGRDEENSADITQQTFLKAMLNIAKYENRGYHFSSWLYRIAINEVNLFFRSLKNEKVVEIDQHKIVNLFEEANIEVHSNTENQDKLIQLLNELPQDQIDLIELRFFQEMNFKEIAEIYSITEANAKMKVYRILEKLNKNF